MGIVRADKKVPAGVLAIFLGFLGVHKFYLGYPKTGLLMLILFGVGLLTLPFLIGTVILGALMLVAFVEGIIYLTRSDYDFNYHYVEGRRPWF